MGSKSTGFTEAVTAAGATSAAYRDNAANGSLRGDRSAPVTHPTCSRSKRDANITSVSRKIALLLAIGAVLAGCVYLRLLEVKSQLQDFDHNFRVQILDQFVLHFRHPVMLSDDFLYLTELEPTRIEQLAAGTRWYVDFHKLDATGQIEKPIKTLTFSMTFDTEKKLTSFGFSPLFLAIAPPEFMEASIRSLGRGNVDTGHRQLRVDPRDLPKIKAALPTHSSIVGTFGKPLLETREQQELHSFYRFLADARPIKGNSGANRLAEVRVSFDPASGELIQMKGKFVGLKLRINYRTLRRLH